MGIIGFDHAQNANVALTTYPDPESAATAPRGGRGVSLTPYV